MSNEAHFRSELNGIEACYRAVFDMSDELTKRQCDGDMSPVLKCLNLATSALSDAKTRLKLFEWHKNNPPEGKERILK